MQLTQQKYLNNIEDACTCPDLTFNNKTLEVENVYYAFMAALGILYATIETTDAFLVKVTN